MTDIFREFDQNQDGNISNTEFIVAMQAFSITLSAQEQEIFFLFMDMDGKGSIKYEEFVRMLRRSGLNSVSNEDKIVCRIFESLKRQNLSVEDAFKAFDINQNNLLSANEVANTLMVMDQRVTREQIDSFFSLADVNGDGQITYEEFYQMFKNNIQDFAIQEKQKVAF